MGAMFSQNDLTEEPSESSEDFTQPAAEQTGTSKLYHFRQRQPFKEDSVVCSGDKDDEEEHVNSSVKEYLPGSDEEDDDDGDEGTEDDEGKEGLAAETVKMTECHGKVVHRTSHGGVTSSNEAGSGSFPGLQKRIVKQADVIRTAGNSICRINNEKIERFVALSSDVIVQEALSRVGEEEDSQKEHNKKLLDELKPGDLTEFPRKSGVYAHWAVYVGNGKVVHMTSHDGAESSNESSSGSVPGSQKGIVKLDDLITVAGDSKGRINNEKDARFPALSSDVIVQEALSRVGEEGEYNVITNNCEHFASFCRYQQAVSDQVKIKSRLIASGRAVTGKLLEISSNNFAALSSEKRAPYAGETSVGSAAEDRRGPLDQTDCAIRQISSEAPENSSLRSVNNLPLSSERPRQTYPSVVRNSLAFMPLSSALDYHTPRTSQYIPTPSSMGSLNNRPRSSEPPRQTYLSQIVSHASNGAYGMPSSSDGYNSSPLSGMVNERLSQSLQLRLHTMGFGGLWNSDNDEAA